MIESGIVRLSDSHYPDSLRTIYKPPEQLYFEGQRQTLAHTCISIVGTRKCTEYGVEMTERIVSELAALDIAIVSGLAEGIDSIAHKAALDNGLSTIAVLGSGLDNVFPKSNRALAAQVAERGLLLSEYPPGTEPLKHHFPARNRIVSGLSIATIVIEAPAKSGTLITARLALNQGREIFALPGDVYRQNSQGIIRLLQNGAAYPIISGKDVIEVLKRQPHLFHPPKPLTKAPKKPAPKNKPELKLNDIELKIYNQLRKTRPKPVDRLVDKLDIDTATLLSTLSTLEVRGIVKNTGGQYLRAC